MTVSEAAKQLEVSASLIYKLCRAGKLRHYRLGVGRGVVRIDPEHVAEFKRESEASPPAPVVVVKEEAGRGRKTRGGWREALEEALKKGR